MSDLTIEADFLTHPKILNLSPDAFRAHVLTMVWCAKHETDGQITSRIAAQFAPGELVNELVAGRLWVRNEDGSFAIRDFLQYNPSRAELEKERARPRRAGGRATTAPAPRKVTPHKQIRDPEITVTEHPDPELDQPEQVRSGRARRWRRVPVDWEPKPAHEQLAQHLGVDMAREVDSFRDHEFRDPKSDADAAFRTWLRNAKRFNGPRLVSSGHDAVRERSRQIIEASKQPALTGVVK